jgi:hypothetical protein
MFMTRVGDYSYLIRLAREHLEPIFSVRRGKATYLEIYRLPQGMPAYPAGNPGV